MRAVVKMIYLHGSHHEDFIDLLNKERSKKVPLISLVYMVLSQKAGVGQGSRLAAPSGRPNTGRRHCATGNSTVKEDGG